MVKEKGCAENKPLTCSALEAEFEHTVSGMTSTVTDCK